MHTIMASLLAAAPAGTPLGDWLGVHHDRVQRLVERATGEVWTLVPGRNPYFYRKRVTPWGVWREEYNDHGRLIGFYVDKLDTKWVLTDTRHQGGSALTWWKAPREFFANHKPGSSVAQRSMADWGAPGVYPLGRGWRPGSADWQEKIEPVLPPLPGPDDASLAERVAGGSQPSSIPRDYYTVENQFGSAGGGRQVVLTPRGIGQAFEAETGHSAKLWPALEELSARGGEVPIEVRRGSRIELTPFGQDHGASVNALSHAGLIALVPSPAGRAYRLTPEGERAIRATYRRAEIFADLAVKNERHMGHDVSSAYARRAASRPAAPTRTAAGPTIGHPVEVPFGIEAIEASPVGSVFVFNFAGGKDSLYRYDGGIAMPASVRGGYMDTIENYGRKLDALRAQEMGVRGKPVHMYLARKGDGKTPSNDVIARWRDAALAALPELADPETGLTKSQAAEKERLDAVRDMEAAKARVEALIAEMPDYWWAKQYREKPWPTTGSVSELRDMTRTLRDYAARIQAAIQDRDEAPKRAAAEAEREAARQRIAAERAAARVAGYRADIPWESATAAHRGTSHVPDERGMQELDDYQRWLEHVHATLTRAAKTPEAQASVPGLFADYRQGYKQRFLAYLSAKSNTVSTMIAGRSNFNASRANKKGATADRRTAELLEWREATLKAFVKDLEKLDRAASLEAKPESARLEEELARLEDQRTRGPGWTTASLRQKEALKSAIAAAKAREARAATASGASPGAGGEMSDIATRIAERERLQEAYKAVNVIVKRKISDDEKMAQIKALGFSDRDTYHYVKGDGWAGPGVPSFKLSNNRAEIKRLQDRLEEVTRRGAVQEAVYPFGATDAHPAGQVEIDPSEERIRVTFAERISSDMHSTMRSGGFVYAPSFKGYSRKLTENGLYAVKRMFRVSVPGAV